MKSDLEFIKDKYGEKMMHLCRSLFPTLLEKPGLLSRLMEEHFAPSKELYNDIVKNKLEYNFKDHIYSFVDIENKEVVSSKSAKELLDDAGYVLYECKTYEEILSFQKYYKHDEELCSFDKDKNRLEDSYVFFAVKKNVDEIKRENFKNPERDDEYGTSVISIQFSKGKNNTLSIKNRYNLTVNDADATFSNNLENIMPGLTTSFERDYHLNINQNGNMAFIVPNYIKTVEGKYYKYNYVLNDIYYCTNNNIINHFNEAIKDYQEKEKYIVLDYFVLDLVNKELKLYDNKIKDCFTDGIKNIEKISIIRNKENNNKTISCFTKENNEIIIEIDKENRIIGYKNDEITEIGDQFLSSNETLKTIQLKNVTKIGNNFLRLNETAQSIYVPNLKIAGNNFMASNLSIPILDLPKLTTLGNNSFYYNDSIRILNLPSLTTMGSYSFDKNHSFETVNIPNRRDLEEKLLSQVTINEQEEKGNNK